MKFAKFEMLNIVREQLALDMNCSPQDFSKSGVTFCESALNEGRRLFTRQIPYLEAATMGAGIVVSVDREILPKVKLLLEDKFRDDLFSAPLFFGHSLYYIPDCEGLRCLPCPQNYTLKIYEGKEILKLYELDGFDNAIAYNADCTRPDVLAICAMAGEKIVGMAGASEDCVTMWQIGIDVLPEFRGVGLAASLVSNLAVKIMERGIVPYYGTASSNIASQSVAHRSGFAPAWMCSYKNTLAGDTPYVLPEQF